MRIKWFVGIIGLFSLCSLLLGSTVQPDSEWRLIEAFHSVKAKPKRYVFHLGGRTEEAIDRTELLTLVKELSSALQLPLPKHTSTKHGVEWKATGLQRNLYLRIHVLNDEPNLSRTHPYISIHLSGRGIPDKQLSDIKKRLAPVLKKYGVNSQFQFSIQGLIPKVNQTPCDTVDEVLMVLHAREIESLRGKKTASITAYTPLLSGGLQSKGNTMNVQVAARKRSGKGGVILTLGTPIITIEY